MTEREQLIQELEKTPDILVGEVLDFLLFIKKKASQAIPQEKTQMVSQTSPFLNFINQLETDLPVQEEEKLPSDFAKNLDHYLYGLAKEAE
ncbi:MULTISPECIES: hypothetical protein [Cyanophyceae]|uniref:hypothetical protein n=1 Tax=Cyanophyceae TaxID=3028117 RepID=UPI0004A9F51E|nr:MULTISPECIES: hypothetical protein [Cyanophyceae]ANV87615.1 hypothetical protein AWQ22_09160 [Picosynechococcus sp. PCC 7117]QCS50301.1 hypothetical protein FEK30_13200 [Picosynechococcus sp. PCC 11901]